jgi:hypothetical protein
MLTEVDLANPHHEHYPGTYANVTLQLEHHTAALKLPESSIGDAQAGGHYVMLVRNGRLIKRAVGVGIRTGHYAEITSGLDGNEEVVATFDPSLTSGEPVTVQLKKQRSPFGAEAVVSNQYGNGMRNIRTTANLCTMLSLTFFLTTAWAPCAVAFENLQPGEKLTSTALSN